MFNESLINCQGFITSSVFEVVADPVKKKKVITAPVLSTTEQRSGIDNGLVAGNAAPRKIMFNTKDIFNRLADTSSSDYQQLDFLYPELVIG